MRATRDITFDIMKGVLIILVVIGHAIQVAYRSTDMNVWLNPIFNFIYTFHMPLFIFISGMFFKKSLNYGYVDLFVKKTKRLLLPVLFYSFLLVFISVIINGEHSISLKFVYKQFTYYWFLICLFIITLFYYFFCKANITIKRFLILAYLGGVLFYNYLPSPILKDCQVIRHIFIFGFGMFVGIDGINKLEVHKFTIIIWCLLAIVLDRILWGFNMMDYPAHTRIVDQFACSIMMCVCLHDVISKVKSNGFTRPFVYLGQNSLGIYLIHMIFPRLMLYTHYTVSYIAHNVLTLVLIWLIVSVVIIELLKRIAKSYSFILGV